MSKISNPCTKCGKERIYKREWKESIPKLLGGCIEVTHVENVCPDSECQKIVQDDLDVQQRKKEKIKADKEQRLKEGAERRTNIRNSKKKLLKDQVV